jgi:methylphosphotriester-DNA--protein-cysteine methyltransferase
VADRTYVLTSATGDPFESEKPGTVAASRRTRIYGRLDCPAALKKLQRGGYSSHRVFFADQQTALAAGYRPCGTCLKADYDAWIANRQSEKSGSTARAS